MRAALQLLGVKPGRISWGQMSTVQDKAMMDPASKKLIDN